MDNSLPTVSLTRLPLIIATDFHVRSFLFDGRSRHFAAAQNLFAVGASRASIKTHRSSLVGEYARWGKVLSERWVTCPTGKSPANHGSACPVLPAKIFLFASDPNHF
jgi:hypothetical protein